MGLKSSNVCKEHSALAMKEFIDVVITKSVVLTNRIVAQTGNYSLFSVRGTKRFECYVTYFDNISLSKAFRTKVRDLGARPASMPFRGLSKVKLGLA